jgi:hypothetical protein
VVCAVDAMPPPGFKLAAPAKQTDRATLATFAGTWWGHTRGFGFKTLKRLVLA